MGPKGSLLSCGSFLGAEGVVLALGGAWYSSASLILRTANNLPRNWVTDQKMRGVTAMTRC